MSDPSLDALAATARNRGLKLVRSRVRTPGKPRFGLVGLSSADGTAVFGLDGDGPTASPDAVEEYLRALEAQDWGASLGAAAQGTPKRLTGGQGARPVRRAPVGRSTKPQKAAPPQVAPKPPPKPEVRAARPADAARVAELIRELGHEIDETQVRKNLALLSRTKETPIVATLDGEIVGLCGVGRRTVISRPVPLGRISTLIVTSTAQGQGIGRQLVEAAEQWMRAEGCELVEVTSNDRRADAHAFYRHLGYDRTSIRFAKKL